MSEDDITSAPEAPASDAPIVVQGLENRFGDFVVHAVRLGQSSPKSILILDAHMTEITRVPIQPVAKGSLTKLWLGVVIAILLGAGLAWTAIPKGLSIETVVAGEGPSPTATDWVFVRYKGMALGTGSVATAQSVESAAIEAKRIEKGTQSLSEDKAYIFIRSSLRSVGAFIKTADAEDLAAYEAEWEEELAEAIEKHPRRLERWQERKAAGARRMKPRPVEPTRENFSIGPIESRLLVSYGPQFVYAKGKHDDGEKYFDYVIEVEPGEYTYYGPMFLGPQGAAGACYCMRPDSYYVENKQYLLNQAETRRGLHKAGNQSGRGLQWALWNLPSRVIHLGGENRAKRPCVADQQHYIEVAD